MSRAGHGENYFAGALVVNIDIGMKMMRMMVGKQKSPAKRSCQGASYLGPVGTL